MKRGECLAPLDGTVGGSRRGRFISSPSSAVEPWHGCSFWYFSVPHRKRALLRGKGPERKAAETRFHDLWRLRSLSGAVRCGHRRLLRVGVVTVTRFTRASTARHVLFASLFLLASKSDVGGHGVKRKLRCSSGAQAGTSPVRSTR